MQGRNSLYTSCQKDSKNVAYKSGDSAGLDHALESHYTFIVVHTC